jgi:hypothetical protein
MAKDALGVSGKLAVQPEDACLMHIRAGGVIHA